MWEEGILHKEKEGIWDYIKIISKYNYKNLKQHKENIKNKIKMGIEYKKSVLTKYNDDDFDFDDLTPKSDLEENKAYINSLDWALSKGDIHNIAVTGPYGAGKSSILKTFEEHRKKYKILNISLALFNSTIIDIDSKGKVDSGNKDDQGDKRELDKQLLKEQEIERRILQQLFYRVKPEKIPFTRYRKIKHITDAGIISKVLLLSFCIGLGVLTLTPQNFFEIGDKIIGNVGDIKLKIESIIGINIGIWPVWIFYIIAIAVILYIATTMIRSVYKRLKISKVSVKGAQIEIDTVNNNNSVFNSNLDEILYFFEANKYDIVFIEDLDRFDNVSIFTKLRELNILINNSEQIEKKVVFIYAIKDDLLKNDERTKFFDFIIPVIPVINSSNSGDMLWRELDKKKLTEGISKEFIFDITVFVHEMRILYNIVNEYQVYRSRLSVNNKSFLEPEKLFAIIVYKNIYPNDFTRLQYNDGIVYNAFNKKSDVIIEKTKKLNDDNRRLREKIEEVRKENLKSIEELKIILLYKISNNSGNIYSFKIGNKEYSKEEFFDIKFNVGDLSKNNLIYNTNYYQGYYGRERDWNNSDISKEDIIYYRNRMESLVVGLKKKIELLREDIERNKSEIRRIELFQLKDLMSISEVNIFFDEIDRKIDLIVFLLRKGHIDEQYHSYMNYFHEGSLTFDDMNFIMSVKKQESLGVSYELKNIDKIMTRINELELTRPETLNINLVNYLLENNSLYKIKLDKIISQISNESIESIEFLDIFIGKVKNRRLFIKLICENWKTFFHFIRELDYTQSRKDDYLEFVLNNASNDEILKFNESQGIKWYLDNMTYFISFSDRINDKEKLKEILLELNVKFKGLLLDDNLNEDIFNFICENNLYEINEELIELILNKKSKINIGDLRIKNFTTILISEYECLISYIKDNLSDYVRSVLLAIDTNIHESEETLKFLMNEDIDNSLKEKILEKQWGQVTDISDINKNVYSLLFKYNSVKPEWDNIVEYLIAYDENNFTIEGDVLNYLNDEVNCEVLEENKINHTDTYEKSIYVKLCSALINCDGIKDNIFVNITKCIPWRFTNKKVENISATKMVILIDNKVLSFEINNYKSVRQYHKGLLSSYIKENILDVLNNQEEYELDNEDIFNIFNDKSISNKDKINVLLNLEDKIVCDTNEYADILADAIIKSNITQKINEELLDNIILRVSDNEMLIKLILKQKDYLSNDNIKKYMDILGGEYSRALKKMKKPKIELNDDTKAFAELIWHKGIINSYNEENDGIRLVALYK